MGSRPRGNPDAVSVNGPAQAMWETLDVEIADVRAVVGDTPHMSLDQAKLITAHITEHQPRHILELGFQHGVSTCYMAAALDQLGSDGHITTIDLEAARDNRPTIEHLLTELGLRDRVTIHYEPTSYTWRMMGMLEADPKPGFDLCYLDGAHSWAVDGFAFFLVDRLLAEHGWIIFDDLDWTYGTSPALANTPAVRSMPADERDAQQVRKVFDLLVKTHPSYGEFRVHEDWGFARKLAASDDRSVVVEYVKERYGFGAFLEKVFRRLR